MRFVIQRVSEASCTVDNEVTGKIGKGFLILVGISNTDTRETADKMLAKALKLRIFEDAQGKTNLDIHTVNGEILMISQFTLYADCRHGNRPSFIEAGKPDHANELYEYLLSECAKQIPVTQRGIFGADMKIQLLNDGPFTVVLDSEVLGIN